MKLIYDFEFVDMGDDGFYGVPVGEGAEQLHGMMKINAVARQMMQYIRESEAPEEVAAKLRSDYPEDDPEEIREQVDKFLETLEREGLLEMKA